MMDTDDLDALRRRIAVMKTSASDVVRTRGHVLGIGPTFIDAICAALGDISVDEALDALTLESLRIRQSIIAENRKADTDGR
jgi:hypothetical protein